MERGEHEDIKIKYYGETDGPSNKKPRYDEANSDIKSEDVAVENGDSECEHDFEFSSEMSPGFPGEVSQSEMQPKSPTFDGEPSGSPKKNSNPDDQSERQEGTPRQCEKCDHIAPSKGKLKAHRKEEHPQRQRIKKHRNEGETFEERNKSRKLASFTTVGHLRHCEYDGCDFSATSRNRMKDHRKEVHLGQEMFRCEEADECDYETFWERNFRRHVAKVHLKIKYSMKEEARYFAEKKAQEKPEKSYMPRVRFPSKKKPFQCPHCVHKCHTEHLLQYHIDTIHLNLQVFQCSQCVYRANTRDILKLHVKNIHSFVGGRLDPCDY